MVTDRPRLMEHRANQRSNRTTPEDSAANGSGTNSRHDHRFAIGAALTVGKDTVPKPDFSILRKDSPRLPESETTHASFASQLTMDDCFRNVAVADLISPIDRNWSLNEYWFHAGSLDTRAKSPLLSDSQNATSGIMSDTFPSRLTTSDSSATSSSGVFSDDHITSAVSDTETSRSPLLPVSTPGASVTETPTDFGAKPPQSYIALIAAAILGSLEKRLILADIYHHVLDNHPYYRSSTCAWRNSIRHNLSVNECFVKSGRARSGRGFYWSVHEACVADFERGDFNRRQARSRVQYASRTLGGSRPTHPSLNRMLALPRVPPPPTSYVPMTSTPARGYLPQFPGYDRMSPMILYNDYVTQPMTVSHANLASSHYHARSPQEEPFLTAVAPPFYLGR